MNQVPQGHGEFYFEPDPREWKLAVIRNRRDHFKAVLWGQYPSKVRAELKMPTERPIVLTGHQPVFFYPGLWAKCLAASELAQQTDAAVYHLITDTALSPEFKHYIPEASSRTNARKQEVDFFSSKELKTKEKMLPYAFLAAPDKPALEKVLEDTRVFGPSAVKDAVAFFADKLVSGLKANRTWNQFHAHTVDVLDRLSGTKRAILEGSAIWASDPFMHFVAYWFIHAADLVHSYNDTLNEYRKEKGITHDIEPVSNLKFDDWYFEMPFWGVVKNQYRDTIWAKTDGKMLTIRLKGMDNQFTFHFDDLENELKASSLRIWPKAIPQTLFLRMYLCDFFIHGIGGGIYEEVVDRFFHKTTVIEPPAYGVISATYFIDPAQNEELKTLGGGEKKLEAWKRALEQNPEYLFTRSAEWKSTLPKDIQAPMEKCFADPKLRELVDQKRKALEDLKDPDKKPRAGKHIKQVNEELNIAYSNVFQAITRGILEAQGLEEAKSVFACREYPFFCYGEDVYKDMKGKIDRALTEGVK